MGNSKHKALIRALREAEEANQKRFSILYEQNRKSHEEYMRFLNEQMKKSKDESDKALKKLRDDMKKQEEEFENKRREKKEKKELEKKQANEQLINDINILNNSLLNECEKDFDDMKDIYCLKEIEQIKISDDIEELFIELFQNRKY